METKTKSLEELVRDLPPEVQVEVRNFAEFLLSKREQNASYTLRQDWAGALREHRERYTALELQRKALEWRGD
jgi:hypothetical protein